MGLLHAQHSRLSASLAAVRRQYDDVLRAAGTTCP
jgi:hypothetical protein